MSGTTTSGWDTTPMGMPEMISGRIEVLSIRADKPICTGRRQFANGDIGIDGTATTFTVPLKIL